MTPAQLARAADQQAQAQRWHAVERHQAGYDRARQAIHERAIACFTREAARIEAERSDIAAAVDDFTTRHTELPYLRAAATARATRYGTRWAEIAI